jgi:hypothetical protein
VQSLKLVLTSLVLFKLRDCQKMENSQCCFCSYEALNNEQLDEHLNLEHSTIFNDDVQQQNPTINGNLSIEFFPKFNGYSF